MLHFAEQVNITPRDGIFCLHNFIALFKFYWTCEKIKHLIIGSPPKRRSVDFSAHVIHFKTVSDNVQLKIITVLVVKSQSNC
jgi:hypothetical protein